MNSEDAVYYHRRAETELERAVASECPEAVRVHYTLAGYYLDRLCGKGEERGDRSHA